MHVDQHRKKRAVAVLALIGIDAVYFGVSNPEGASPLVIIVGGVLVLVTVYVLASVAVAAVSVFMPLKRTTQKRLVWLSSLILAFLILMQSIGQLGWRDVLAALPFFLVAYLYITYNSVNSEGQGL